MNRKTKLIVTYGPSISGEEELRRILEAGADVVRLNFSHGTHEQYAEAIRLIRRLAGGIDRPVAILQDLRGPKIRVGRLDPSPMELIEGREVLLIPAPSSQGSGRIPFEGHPDLGAELAAGDPVLLDDGALRLIVLGASAEAIRCRVVTGGPLSSGKGINLPDSQLEGLDGMTEKDEADLDFGLRHGVDFIALSFVRKGKEIERLRKRIEDRGATTPIIAKIEMRAALRNLEEIVAVSDGVMVARGDLGVETELAEVALRQKEIIRVCNQIGKVVITATQMLESMIGHPTPTRAEVSDVSNAILDGSDALMLSGETAIGRYPVEAVRMLDSIALRTEEVIDTARGLARRPFLDEIPDAVAHASVVLAHEVGAAAIICSTRGGMTARLVSRYRPSQPVFAVSPREEIVRRLAIVWGVRALSMEGQESDEQLLCSALERCRTAGLVHIGDRVVVTSGSVEGGLEGRTNLIRVEIV